ncbi:hypothetical protein CC78DRAFT_293358 [Lojkania enalia]|uniref:Uncharacterized protein n=1 Tax=Lojkania enalia TaxID=147567 RepID=A0A9P4KBF0_9PLEO|nr:hypothetical protein CC78DRAFT_293358 [Didymosphaeria enalia]
MGPGLKRGGSPYASPKGMYTPPWLVPHRPRILALRRPSNIITYNGRNQTPLSVSAIIGARRLYSRDGLLPHYSVIVLAISLHTCGVVLRNALSFP